MTTATAPLASPTAEYVGSEIHEGVCPRGGKHIYGIGLTICDRCGGNRLHQPEHVKDSSWRR